MTIAYFQIVRVLWKSDTIPGHRESRNQTYMCGCKYYNYILILCLQNVYCKVIGLHLKQQRQSWFNHIFCCCFRLLLFWLMFFNKQDLRSGPSANSSTMGQLRARRKAAKMLVAVVVMFASCFFPVHCLNIVR